MNKTSNSSCNETTDPSPLFPPNNYVSPQEAARRLGVSVDSLRRWETAGKIKAIRTPSGQRRFDINSYVPGDKPDTKPKALPDLKKELEELINLYLEEADSAKFKAKLKQLAIALGIL